MPTVGVKLLCHRTPRRDFLTTDQVRTPIERAETARGNRPLLADLIKVLAYSGAREMEALRLRWQDVDFNLNASTSDATDRQATASRAPSIF